LGAFSLPVLFKDRIIIIKARTNGFTGSTEKGLLRDIKLLLGNSGVEAEHPEWNQFRI